jgi:electron transfer flavoprotein alpha subunit
MKILVFSEQAALAFELLGKACELGEASAAILGANVSAKVVDYFAYGANKVYVGEDARLAQFSADCYADALAQIVGESGASVLLLGSSKRGKELAGRVAQKLDCGCITDAIGLGMQDGKLAAQRYALGGNTVATGVILSERQIIAAMPKTFEAVRRPAAGEAVPVELKLSEPRLKIVERKAKTLAAADIESAERLIVVGKGFAKQEDLVLAQALAQKLHAELGCTRALAADLHWLGEERMVGISGKKCKPRLMLSVGVSGQIQHTVAISASKTIVAVNKDKTAPIFKMADYGIVGDLYDVLPRLTERVGQN